MNSLADGEGLRQALRFGLLRELEIAAQLRTVTEQLAEVGQVVRGADDQISWMPAAISVLRG